ncbi:MULTISPECIES: RNA methyltransferase [unclassified Haematospirillum]|uniref:RNA methyltransferase n=1 Tax=unclassified Haematospirillum TaxID=2622088 RepID=UPI00143B5143|nr:MULTISPECIES: RNA methyltransferase [unclassified Haematospirillum]NKD55489.1 RNA methyltransferase [Haematospirillum sp. H4890]NKD75629.1 RNA methyltransferase [Haematospirillum sp. H4485]NKD86740.1 RNA methyltransferase [Haematospirillum sp. 15-248]
MSDIPAEAGWRERGRALLPKDVTAARGVTPAIILVEPQLGENIGTCARAMGNCGLGDLRLVRPRPDHLTERARAASSGADAVLEQARIYDSTEDAVADLVHVYATTARRRDMMKRLVTPRQAGAEMRLALAAQPSQPAGILFGRERTGLENDDVALASAVMEIPLNPWFCSLNLAQAVLLVGYEWFTGLDETPSERPPERQSSLATQEELSGLYQHLERELDASGFLRVPEKRPGMVRNIRSIFARNGLSSQEVRTLHGIVRELRWGRRPDRPPRNSNGSNTPPDFHSGAGDAEPE